MNAARRLEGIEQFAIRRVPAWADWPAGRLRDYIRWHLEQGTMADVWWNGRVAGIGVAWECHDGQFEFQWQRSDPTGDCIYVAAMVADPGVIADLAAQFQLRFPEWRRKTLVGHRRGRVKRYRNAARVLDRILTQDRSARAQEAMRFEAAFAACMAKARSIVASVKAQYPHADGVVALSVDAPPPRDLAQESRDTLQAQVDLAPELFAREAEFRPLYAALERRIAADSLRGSDGAPGIIDILAEVQPAIAELNRAGATAQRTADVADVERLGPRATAALLAANPQQQAIVNALNAQAIEELNAGARLDPSLAREVSQGVRAGQAARGFGYGRDDLASETLARGMAAEQLRRNRQQFGMQVAGLNQSVAGDPFLAVLGRQATIPTQGQSLLNQGYGISGAAGPRLFDPFHPYAADLYNTNYNAKSAANIASGNQTAGIIGGVIGGLGSLGGGWLAGR